MFQHLCCVEWPLKFLAMLDSKGALKKVLSKYQEILLDFNLNLNEKCHNLQPLQFPSMSGYSCFWELSLFTFPSDILPPGPRSMSGEQLTGGPRKTKMSCGQNTEECRRPKLKPTARRLYKVRAANCLGLLCLTNGGALCNSICRQRCKFNALICALCSTLVH